MASQDLKTDFVNTPLSIRSKSTVCNNLIFIGNRYDIENQPKNLSENITRSLHWMLDQSSNSSYSILNATKRLKDLNFAFGRRYKLK